MESFAFPCHVHVASPGLPASVGFCGTALRRCDELGRILVRPRRLGAVPQYEAPEYVHPAADCPNARAPLSLERCENCHKIECACLRRRRHA